MVEGCWRMGDSEVVGGGGRRLTGRSGKEGKGGVREGEVGGGGEEGRGDEKDHLELMDSIALSENSICTRKVLGPPERGLTGPNFTGRWLGLSPGRPPGPIRPDRTRCLVGQPDAWSDSLKGSCTQTRSSRPFLQRSSGNPGAEHRDGERGRGEKRERWRVWV